MAGKLISTTIISDNNEEKPVDKRDGKFVKKSFPRPWEVELTDEEIENMKNDAEANAEADKERLRKSQLSNEASSMCFQMEKAIIDFGDKVSDSDKQEISDKIGELRKIMDGEDLDAIESTMKALSDKMNVIASAVYAADQQAQATETPSEQTSDSAEDLQDVEYEEIK